MARKFQDISQLYKENIAELSSKEENWKDFLSVACKFYKYSFPDQVLIYAQRPDATACASYEFWNGKMKRYVNKGAKGIALIDDSGQWSRLKYVFDISDTHAARGVPNPYLWEMKPDFEQNIREAFIANIGEVEEKQNNDFSDFIKSISDMAVTDNIVDYMEQFENIENWGLLESFPQESKNIFFDALVKESVFYTVSKRLGIDIEDNNKYIQNLNLVTIFNSAETLIETGTAVSDISEIVLRYAERAIKQIENPYVFDYREFFAENSKWLHNDDENRNKIETERSSRYESDLQSDRDLSYTQYTNEHTKTADGQIRNDEKNISEGTQKGSLQPNADDGNIKSAPFRNRQTGEGTVGSNNEEAAISRERTRQGQKLTGVDTVPKQLTLESGGIYNANDLQINDENEKTEDLKSSAFFMPEEVHTEPKKEIYIEPVNFKITDTDLGKGGAKTKAQNNINAIKLLQTLENENRNATPDEQEILSKYVGWGGIPQAFDRNNSNWTKEYDEIKNLLTETEYEKARESTLTAFYTSPIVCRSIYKVIENMGFKTGNILEIIIPSLIQGMGKIKKCALAV